MVEEVRKDAPRALDMYPPDPKPQTPTPNPQTPNPSLKKLLLRNKL